MNRRNFLGWTAVGAAGLLLPVPKRVTTVVFGSGKRLGFIPSGWMVLRDGTRIPFRELRVEKMFRELEPVFDPGTQQFYGRQVPVSLAIRTNPARVPGSEILIMDPRGNLVPLIESPVPGSRICPSYSLWAGE